MTTATLNDAGIAEVEARFRAEQARVRRKRRLLPVAGIVGFILFWAALVYGLRVPPFVAPSPVAVLETLIINFPKLMENLLPTAIEAVSGFIIGNLAAVLLATAFVHQQ